MMSWTRLTLWTVLLAVLLVNVADACQDSTCCGTTGCESCRSSCSNNCNSGCTTGSNCCSTCRARCCQQCSSTIPAPAPTPERIIVTSAPSSYVVPESSTLINSTNVNHNNFSVPVEVRIENVISNHNNISVPINITVQTFNDVHIQSESSGMAPSLPSPAPPVPVPVPTCQNTTTVMPVRVPYPYPVPYYQRPSPGCCHVVQPCVPQGCQWHSTQCGSSCRSPVMFRSSNPCQTGCQRMDSSYQTWCFGRDHCRNIPVDCSRCPNEFYNDYSTFARCGGCFKQNFGDDLLGGLSWPWTLRGGASVAQPYADQGGFA